MGDVALNTVNQIRTIIKKINRAQRIIKNTNTYFFNYMGSKNQHKMSISEEATHTHGYSVNYIFIRYLNVNAVGITEISAHDSKYYRNSKKIDAIKHSEEYSSEELYKILQLLYKKVEKEYNYRKDHHSKKDDQQTSLLGDGFDDL